MFAAKNAIQPVALVLCLLATHISGARAWQTTISGAACSVDAAYAVTLDPAGDVLAAGMTVNSGFGDADFTVTKLAGVDGTERWRRIIDGGAHDWDQASAVTVDRAGNVIAAGEIRNTPNDDDFAVVKLRADDGAIVWSQAFDISGFLPPPLWPGPDDDAYSITTDRSGDVIAAGVLSASYNGSGLGEFFVIKLDGSTGTERWHFRTGGQANAAVVDGNDDVLVAGSAGATLVAVKLDGRSGASLWHVQITSPSAGQGLALLADGDVVAGGTAAHGTLITRLRGEDGAQMWAATPPLQVDAVAVDANGAVMAAGGGVTKLASDGSELWHQTVPGRGWLLGFAAAAAIDANGDVVAAGAFDDRAILKLSGATGAELWPATADRDAQALGIGAVTIDRLGNVIGAGSHAARNDFTVVKLNGADGTSFGPRTCPGDCNRDGQVTVDELLIGVDIGLGTGSACACIAVDVSHDGRVTIDEILTAVDGALEGCVL